MWTWSRSAVVSCVLRLILNVSKWQSVLWLDESKCDILVGNHGHCVLWAKEAGDLPACSVFSSNPAHLMVWGCISAYGMDSLHVLEGTMNAKRYIKVLEQHMLPSRQRLFQGRPCVFQQDNVKPHTAAITTAWLRSRRVRVLNWPACSPDLSPIENIWCIIKQKICQRRPQTLQQLETYIRQEWIVKYLSLNICYVIYVLLWIKYWLMWVIWNYFNFSFHFIQI